MEAYYSIVKKDSEYRILLTPVNVEVLPENIFRTLSDRHVDISELIIERISGDDTTGQDVLHDITSWIAEIFANNQNLMFVSLFGNIHLHKP